MDGLVLADVDIVRIVGDVQIGAIGNVGVVLIGRGGNDLDFADLLGFGNGLLGPSTGLDGKQRRSSSGFMGIMENCRVAPPWMKRTL